MLRKGVANQGKRLTQFRRQSANAGASVAVKVSSFATLRCFVMSGLG